MNIIDDSWRRVTGGRARREEFFDLVCRYSDTARHYHNFEHIRDMLRNLYQTDVREDRALHRAIWWHDAIYDSTRSDNEERSAELAAQTLTVWNEPSGEIDRVVALILITKRHEVPANDGIAKTLIDLDLQILAAPSEKYDLYAVQVRAEYAWVPDGDYVRGRADFLKRMLARERILINADLDAIARANMTREQERLANS
jgi:predicted metal-dependent HD superfamily phosphohydrolase